MRTMTLVRIGGAIFLALAGTAACSTSSNGNGNSDDGGLPEAATCSMPGAAAQGPMDTHCVMNGMQVVQPTDPASCYVDAAAGDDGGAMGDDGGAAGDDGGAADAGDIGNCGDPAYGPTMYGTSGADDDCKYDISWTSTPICEGYVYFTVTATHRTDHSPVTGANIRPDVVLDCTHPITNNPADPSPEVSPGVYTVGPVLFDKPGKWVVRFHLNENCFDIADTSPHGHAAFYVQVP